MKKLIALLMLFGPLMLMAQDVEYRLRENVPYYTPDEVKDDYQGSQCVLDIYYPEHQEDFPTVVWFHGGGLTGGDKYIPDGLKEQGICVVAVKYRLYPKIKCPVYIEDAAAAVAWVFKNIEKFGGDPSKIFISGHSAGGYLTAITGMDPQYLAAHDVDANSIAGLIPFSGHMITHFTIRRERDIPGEIPVIDPYAPLYHVRKNAPPLLLITGDRNLEMLGRYEENAYMMRMMKVAGHEQTRILELQGYGHGMVEPAIPLLIQEVKRISDEIESGE